MPATSVGFRPLADIAAKSIRCDALAIEVRSPVHWVPLTLLVGLFNPSPGLAKVPAGDCSYWARDCTGEGRLWRSPVRLRYRSGRERPCMRISPRPPASCQQEQRAFRDKRAPPTFRSCNCAPLPWTVSRRGPSGSGSSQNARMECHWPASWASTYSAIERSTSTFRGSDYYSSRRAARQLTTFASYSRIYYDWDVADCSREDWWGYCNSCHRHGSTQDTLQLGAWETTRLGPPLNYPRGTPSKGRLTTRLRPETPRSVPVVQLGSRRLTNVPVLVADLPVFGAFGVVEGRHHRKTDWLESTRMVIDFPAKLVWFEPPR